MKKIFLFLLMAMAGVVSAATDTPTSTYTPTLTPTNTPVAVFGGPNQAYLRFQPNACIQDDGITAPGTSALPGATTVWLAQTLNTTTLVLSTGTAATRMQFVVPADYQQGGKLWMYASISSATNTAQIAVNAYRTRMNALTSTVTSLLGVTTNVQTQYVGPLDTGAARMSRVYLPLSGTVGMIGQTGLLKVGDVVNLQVVRGGGTVGNINVRSFEFEYVKKPYYNP